FLWEGMVMATGYRFKCLNCHKLFRPDPRNRRHQKYCSQPECRAASKAASQQRWLAKPENVSYFKGPVHVNRVQQWRAAHPGHGQSRPSKSSALQDLSITQPTDNNNEIAKFANHPLQEIINAQPAVLIGLIAHFAASPLQDDIAFSARQLIQLGRDILASHPAGGSPHGGFCP
ncbi:hypothetical protein, partial [Ferrovum myxofaciens]